MSRHEGIKIAFGSVTAESEHADVEGYGSHIDKEIETRSVARRLCEARHFRSGLREDGYAKTSAGVREVSRSETEGTLPPCARLIGSRSTTVSVPGFHWTPDESGSPNGAIEVHCRWVDDI